MKHGIKILAVIVCLTFIAAMSSTVFAQAKKEPPPDYYPLHVGYWWKYKSVEKGWVFTIKVTAVEKIGDKECYKVETLAADGSTTFAEYYLKTKDTVFWVREANPKANSSVDFTPDRILIRNPLGVGQTWSWKGKGQFDVEIEENSNVLKADTVVIGKNKYGTLNVETKVNQGGQDVLKSYWYGNHIGLVKSFVDSGGFKSTLELIEYNLKAK